MRVGEDLLGDFSLLKGLINHIGDNIAMSLVDSISDEFEEPIMIIRREKGETDSFRSYFFFNRFEYIAFPILLLRHPHGIVS